MEELPPQEFYKMVTTEQNLVTGKIKSIHTLKNTPQNKSEVDLST